MAFLKGWRIKKQKCRKSAALREGANINFLQKVNIGKKGIIVFQVTTLFLFPKQHITQHC